MTLTLWHHPLSPPSRAVIVTAKLLKIPLREQLVDLAKGEHLASEFVKMNPGHTIPVLLDKDKDLVLSESRAILAYLCGKACSSSLYPRDLQKRAKVDQFLYFDTSTISVAVRDIRFTMLFQRSKPSQQMWDTLKDRLNILGVMLEGKRFAIGDQFTIADISLACSVGFFITEGQHAPQNVADWYERVLQRVPTLAVANKAEAAALTQIISALG